MSTTAERVEKMMAALGKDQPGFGALSGASKSVVNQWLSGEIKSISARYAFKLQRSTGFSAEWIQTGEGPQTIAAGLQATNSQSAALEPEQAEVLHLFERFTPSQKKALISQMREMADDNERLFEELSISRSKNVPENKPGFRLGGAIVENATTSGKRTKKA